MEVVWIFQYISQFIREENWVYEIALGMDDNLIEPVVNKDFDSQHIGCYECSERIFNLHFLDGKNVLCYQCARRSSSKKLVPTVFIQSNVITELIRYLQKFLAAPAISLHFNIYSFILKEQFERMHEEDEMELIDKGLYIFDKLSTKDERIAFGIYF